MEKSAANTDLIRGHVITIILRSLQGNDKYGYEICREIEVKSEGSYVLKQPTLYSCLKRLESQGYISSYLGEISNGGRRRYYSLTEKGEEFLERDKQEWEFSRTLINRLLSDKDYDLTQPPPFNPSDLRPYTRKMNEAKATEESLDANEVIVEEKPAEETPIIVEETVVTPEPYETTTVLEQETVEERIEEVVETIPEEKPAKTSFSIFDLMPTAEDEENEEVNTYDEDEPISYVVPIEQDTVDEDDLVAINEDVEESDASKIIADAYDPYYGESYSEPVSPENAYSSLFDNNNSVNEFFGITKEEIDKEDEEEQVESGPIDLFAPIETKVEQEEPVYEKEENYYVVPNREVSAYQSSQLSPKVAVEEVIEEIVEDSITAHTVQEQPKDTDEKNYKSAFSKLFNTEATDVPSREVVAPKDVSEMRKTRDLPPAASMADLKKNYYAEGFNLKTYNRSNTEIYYNMNYMYSNKLNCVTCWVLYALILLEIGLTFLFDSGRVLSNAFFIATPLIALIVPGIPTVLMVRNPQKRIKAEFDFNKSLINSSLLALNLAIIIAAIGFVCGVPLNDFTQITIYIILPVIYTLNIPIGILIYYWLFNSKKFHLS